MDKEKDATASGDGLDYNESFTGTKISLDNSHLKIDLDPKEKQLTVGGEVDILINLRVENNEFSNLVKIIFTGEENKKKQKSKESK